MSDNLIAATATLTPGQRAYQDYFRMRDGKNTEGNPLPNWSELASEWQYWWELRAIEPPGSPPFWKAKVFWFNALVLVLAFGEANFGMLKDFLPGSIYAYVAFGLPLANKLIRLYQLYKAGK